VRGGRTPCDCSADVFDPAALTGGIATVPEGSRRRHVAVLADLAERGPGAVVGVVRGVTKWVDRTVAGLVVEQEQHWERLRASYGVTKDEDLPRGVKADAERRYKRRQTELRARAVERFLDDLATHLRDLLVVQAGAGDTALIHLDVVDAARADAARLPTAAILRGLGDIARCREALGEFNGQPELQIEAVLTPLAAAVFAATRAA
jgi:hypothetical protein